MTKYTVYDNLVGEQYKVEASSYQEACVKAIKVLGVDVYETEKEQPNDNQNNA